ncbi:MAG: response regulator [Chloroherpetonaceae bacterium]
MPVHRLLVIDDDARIHQTFKAILAKYPIEFESAFGAEEALEKLRAESYSLVLLDIIMPEVDGIEFLERASREGLFLPPIIVVSSATDKAFVMQALSFGASSYLFKPIDVAKFRAAVSDYLGMSAITPDDSVVTPKPLPESLSKTPEPPPPSAIAVKPPPPPIQTASEFTSISRAMGNMVFHRRTATLYVHTKMSGVGELVYKDGKLKSVSFNGMTGIDALEAMKSVDIEKILIKG